MFLRFALEHHKSRSSRFRITADDTSLSPRTFTTPCSGSNMQRTRRTHKLKVVANPGFQQTLVQRLAQRRLALLCRLALAIYLPALVLATHMPPKHLRRLALPIPISDKLAHFTAYAILAVLVVMVALSFSAVRRMRPAGWATLALGGMFILGCLGLCDEWTQPALGRQFDWLDWAADLGGIATAAGLAALYVAVKPRRSMWA